MVDCGCDVIVGTEHEVDTVTVAVLLLADPQAFDTRTQYEKVWLPPTRNDCAVVACASVPEYPPPAVPAIGVQPLPVGYVTP